MSKALVAATTACGLLSFCCSTFLAVSIKCNLRYAESVLLFRAVMYMAICDAGWSLWIVAVYFPPLVGEHGTYKDDSVSCNIMAFIGQFVEVAALSWYFVIGCMMFMILTGWSTQKLHEHSVLHHVYVWALSFIAATVPLVAGQYGPVDRNGWECWIMGEDSLFRLFFYMPIILYMCFSLCLLLFALHKRHMFGQMEMGRILTRLALFVGVFVTIWSVPTVYRLYPIVTGNTWDAHPDAGWMETLHHLSEAMTGFANFLVWVSYRPARMRSVDHSMLAHPESALPGDTEAYGSGYQQVGWQDVAGYTGMDDDLDDALLDDDTDDDDSEWRNGDFK